MKYFNISLISLFLIVLNISAQPLQRVAPEDVGLSSTHLQYADEAIEKAITSGDIPGAVLAVVKDGKMA